MSASTVLKELGIHEVNSGVYAEDWIAAPGGGELVSVNPTTGQPLARVLQANEAEYEQVFHAAQRAFLEWRMVPAPRRGELVRALGDALREKKDLLGSLVTLEMGKIKPEGLGEVQEMIDMCDFAVGQSRMLYGLQMHSERPGHRMFEQWHPLGPVGLITSFNFPIAVWAWNSCLAAICGDSVIWKPSSQTPLTAIAVQKIAAQLCKDHGVPPIFTLCVGKGSTVGERLVSDRRVPLISATASCDMGRRVNRVMADHLGRRALLELGGNNAIIVMDDADLSLANRAVLFGAVGTAGQRCTSTRRVYLHKKIAGEFTERLLSAYKQIRIGDPLEEGTLMGPLVDQAAVDIMLKAIDEVKKEGGEILTGGKRIDRPGYFVEPTIAKVRPEVKILREETFAPLLYLVEVDSLDQAIEYQNGVDQGLSSAIFTRNLQSAETFLSPRGSDCGIANVNIGTSGAEIGGAFGGEKDTGGGRESGSDSWKIYMRRQTCTVNYSNHLPLAQGIKFGD
ncbi:MAG: aldehyde dehydrogenase family protein [Candidatus Eisenbacteria bacterium]|nr:aldehyde dehydrogenase family protein [Candidatus Eisenbacteria bacterium]